MIDPSIFISDALGRCIWQTTAILAAGIGASWLLTRRPARGHRVLTLAIGACLLAVPVSELFQRMDWGIFNPRPFSMVESEAFRAPTMPGGFVGARRVEDGSGAPDFPATSFEADNAGADRTLFETAATTPAATERGGLQTVSGPSDVGQPNTAGLPHRTIAIPRWADWFFIGWCALSLACLGRLALAIWSGRRLVATATADDDAAWRSAVKRAVERLSLRIEPDVRATAAVACPMIWCWGRRPILILPSAAPALSLDEYAAVFCHELAHWQRRDHWTRLLAELLVCVFPWQPLAWAAGLRLRRLSERACDDWVLEAGHSPARYAETLLSLTPQRRERLALAAVARASDLRRRIERILADVARFPRSGVGWSLAACGVAASALVLVGLSQPRMTAGNRESTAKPEVANAQAADAPGAGDKAGAGDQGNVLPVETVAGVVVDANGVPQPNVSVWLMNGPIKDGAIPTAEVTTNSKGEFRFGDVNLNEMFDYYHGREVFARDARERFGWQTNINREQAGNLRIALHETVTTALSLRTEEGQPIGGATIELQYLWPVPFKSANWESSLVPTSLRSDAVISSKSEGSFEVRKTISDKAAGVFIDAPGFGRFNATFDGGKAIDLVLPRGGSVAGNLVLGGGPVSGAAGAKIYISPASGTAIVSDKKAPYQLALAWNEPSVDETGAFTASGLPTGSYQANANPSDSTPYWVDKSDRAKFDIVAGQTTSGVTIPVRPAISVRGKVVGPDGKGVAGVTVQINRLEEGAIRDSRRAETDAEGNYVGYTRPGRLMMAIARTPEVYLPMRITERRPEIEFSESGEWPELRLMASGRVEGTVVDESGNPVPYAEVRACSIEDQFLEGSRPNRNGFRCDALGRFIVTRVDPDDNLPLRARSGDATTAEALIVVPGELTGPVQLVISEKHAARVRGTIVDGDGQPVANAIVSITGAWTANSKFFPGRGWKFPLETAQSGGDGRFESHVLWPADRYQAEVRSASGAIVQSAEVSLAAGETRELPRMVVAGGERIIKGIVVDSVGRALAEARVYEMGKRNEKRTGSDGRFEIKGGSMGPTLLFAEREGFQLAVELVRNGQPVQFSLAAQDHAGLNYVPLAGAPTLAERRAIGREILERMWGTPAIRTESNAWPLIHSMLRLDPQRALEWSAELGKYGSSVRCEIARRVADQDLEQAVALIGEAKDAAAVAEFIRLARRFAERDAEKAQRCIELARSRVGQLSEPERSGDLAQIGALLTQCGQKDQGAALIRDAAAVSATLAVKPGDISIYWRGTVAGALATIDLGAALELLRSLTGHEYIYHYGKLIRQIAQQDPARATELLKGIDDVFQRDQIQVAVAYQVGLNNPTAAVALADGIESPQYKALGYSWVAVAIAPRDQRLAWSLLDRAMEVASKKRDSLLGYMNMGGPGAFGARLAQLACMQGHPNAEEFVNRALAMGLPPNQAISINNWFDNNAATAAMLATVDPHAAWMLLETIEPQMGQLNRGELFVGPGKYLAAWALVNPKKAETLVNAELDHLDTAREQALWRSGVLGAVEALISTPEELDRSSSSIMANTPISYPNEDN